MSIALHLRPRTTGIKQRCIAFFRTSLKFRMMAPEKIHTWRGTDHTPIRGLGSIDLATGTYIKRLSFHSSSHTEFHSTPQVMLPVRRRRRGTGRKTEPRSEDATSDENDGITTLERIHAPVTNSHEFDQASSRLLDKIEKAMEPMKVSNEIFNTKRADGELGEIFTIDLGPKVGIYQIEISQDEHVFEYSSPVSGKLLYCLSSATGEWVNIDDGHQFEGILVRDLLRSNCIGLPKL